jgi:hypothetical protein
MPRPPVYNGVPFGLGAAANDFGYTSGGAPTYGPIIGGLGAITLGSGEHIDFSSWVSPTITSDRMLGITDGTAATPSVVNGAVAMFDKTYTLSGTGCQNTFDPNCGSTVRIGASGSATNAQQVTGLAVMADNRSTAGPIVGGDTAAISASARAKSGLAIGVFAAGARRSGDSNTVRMHAIEVQADNDNGTDCTSNDDGDGCYGVFAVSQSDNAARHNTAGFGTRSTGANTSTEKAFYHGFQCTSNGAVTSCFEDVSRAVSALRARGGAYVDVLDLTGATASGSGIKLPNTTAGKISWGSMLLDPATPLFNPVSDGSGLIGTDANRWNTMRAVLVKGNVFQDSTGAQGLDVVKTVRDSLGLADCTMTFSAGLLTASTCA